MIKDLKSNGIKVFTVFNITLTALPMFQTQDLSGNLSSFLKFGRYSSMSTLLFANFKISDTLKPGKWGTWTSFKPVFFTHCDAIKYFDSPSSFKTAPQQCMYDLPDWAAEGRHPLPAAEACTILVCYVCVLKSPECSTSLVVT